MIEAIKDKVIAKLMTRTKTASGLVIPNSVQEPQAFCKVISVGDEVKSVEVGDLIVCHMRGGMDVLIDREIIKVLKEDEIYGKLTHQETIDTLEDIQVKEPSTIIQPQKTPFDVGK